MRWFLLAVLTLSSFIFTGCEKGSLGVKGGTITGYVLEYTGNTPLPEVLIRATHHDSDITTFTKTGADGSYTVTDLRKGLWEVRAEKFGYTVVMASETQQEDPYVTSTIENGETIIAPTLRMVKTMFTMKGTLKGYPIDGITARPLRNFTVTQMSPLLTPKVKLFESAEDFKTTGWQNLTAGTTNQYKITCENYEPYTTDPNIVINQVPMDLGVIKMTPLKVNISGTLRNLPGHIVGDSAAFNQSVIWAEAAGKIVASPTTGAAGGFGGGIQVYQGTVGYTLPGVPVTAGTVAVKCKIRGYDVITINPSVSIPQTMPGGTIANIDADFANIDPISREVRVIVQSNSPSDSTYPTYADGETARVFIKQGGRDVVPYVDIVAQNNFAEAYFANVPAGYNVDFIVQHQNRGYIKGELNTVLIPEDGDSIFTVVIKLAFN